MSVADRLAALDFSGSGPEPPAEVKRLEELIGVPLPTDYRDFLLDVGGGHVEAYAPCDGPTPFGGWFSVTVLHTAARVIGLLDSTVTPRNMICVSYGHGGMTGCLSIAGLDRGQAFALDTEMRYYWREKELAAMPHLAPEIREFFRLRDTDELQERPWGYDNCYRAAGSFTEFLARLRHEDEM